MEKGMDAAGKSLKAAADATKQAGKDFVKGASKILHL